MQISSFSANKLGFSASSKHNVYTVNPPPGESGKFCTEIGPDKSNVRLQLPFEFSQNFSPKEIHVLQNNRGDYFVATDVKGSHETRDTLALIPIQIYKKPDRVKLDYNFTGKVILQNPQTGEDENFSITHSNYIGNGKDKLRLPE